MYVQRGWGVGRIGWVVPSKSGRTLRYGDVELCHTGGYKQSHMDARTRAGYWVSRPRRDGQDTLYPGVVEIDDDAREAYWAQVRPRPAGAAAGAYRSRGVHGRGATR